MNIREIKIEDAAKVTKLMQQIDESSEYMLWEAGERKLDVKNQLKMITEIKNAPNSTIFIAEKDNELIGYLLALGGKAQRNKHAVYIVIGILKGFRGEGIGTKLFQAIDKWAAKNSIRRLELTVVTKNAGGVALYKKAGFEIEGTKRNSLHIDGEFVDEYYMAKLL